LTLNVSQSWIGSGAGGPSFEKDRGIVNMQRADRGCRRKKRPFRHASSPGNLARSLRN